MARHQDQVETGFVREISPVLARRQLTVSLAVIVSLAVSTAMVAGAGQLKPRYPEPAVAKLTVQAPGTIEVRRADTRGDRAGG